MTTTTTLPDLSALKARAVEAVNFLRFSPERGMGIVRQMHDELASLKERWDLPEAQKVTGRRLIRETARRKVNEHKFAVREAEQAVDEYAKVASRAQYTDESAAAETRRVQGWSRLRDHLEHLPDNQSHVMAARHVIESAVANGDVGPLEGARRELPSWLAARQSEWPDVFARQLDAVAGPPEAQEAVAFLEQNSRGVYRSKVAANSIATGFDADTTAVVPGWDEGSLVYLDEAA